MSLFNPISAGISSVSRLRLFETDCYKGAWIVELLGTLLGVQDYTGQISMYGNCTVMESLPKCLSFLSRIIYDVFFANLLVRILFF